MKAGSIFLSIMLVLIIFNFMYIQTLPDKTNMIVLGAIMGLVSSVLVIGVVGGIQILGTGLNGESIKIMFGVGTLLNILFQINIGGFPIGLGLINNLLNTFVGGDLWGLGYLLATSIAIMALLSGLMIILGSGE